MYPRIGKFGETSPLGYPYSEDTLIQGTKILFTNKGKLIPFVWVSTVEGIPRFRGDMCWSWVSPLTKARLCNLCISHLYWMDTPIRGTLFLVFGISPKQRLLSRGKSKRASKIFQNSLQKVFFNWLRKCNFVVFFFVLIYFFRHLIHCIL